MILNKTSEIHINLLTEAKHFTQKTEVEVRQTQQ